MSVKRTSAKRNGSAKRPARPAAPVPDRRISTPASLNAVLTDTLPAGVVSAFIFLGYLPKRDARLDLLLLDFRALPEASWADVNIESLCAERGIEAWEFLMWTVGAVTSMGGNASQLIINSMKYPVTKASLERAMNDPEEAREWQRSWGHFTVPQKSQVINVNASASAQSLAAQSATERGLPSFADTTDEADELLALPSADAEFTVDLMPAGAKEPANANPDPDPR